MTQLSQVGGLFHNMRANLDFFRDNMAMNDNVLSVSHQGQYSTESQQTFQKRALYFRLSRTTARSQVEILVK